MYATGRTRTLSPITGKEQTLAFPAPAPIRLTYEINAVVPDHCVMPAVACVMSLMVRGANSLARIAGKKCSLALVTRPPIPLLSRDGALTVTAPRFSFAEVYQIFAAPAGVMRLTVRGADSPARIPREKKTLALEAPFPVRLKIPFHFLFLQLANCNSDSELGKESSGLRSIGQPSRRAKPRASEIFTPYRPLRTKIRVWSDR